MLSFLYHWVSKKPSEYASVLRFLYNSTHDANAQIRHQIILKFLLWAWMLQPFNVDRHVTCSFKYTYRTTQTLTAVLTIDKAGPAANSCFNTQVESISCNIRTLTSTALYVHNYVIYGRQWILCVGYTSSRWYMLGDGLRLYALALSSPPADASTLHPSLPTATSTTLCRLPLFGSLPLGFLCVRFPWPPMITLSTVDVSSPYCTATGSALVPAFVSVLTSATQ